MFVNQVPVHSDDATVFKHIVFLSMSVVVYNFRVYELQSRSCLKNLLSFLYYIKYHYLSAPLSYAFRFCSAGSLFLLVFDV